GTSFGGGSSPGDGPHGAIQSVAKTGGAFTTLASEVDFPDPIATDGSNVYVGTLTRLIACPLAGCANPPDVLVENERAFSIVADGTSLYWTTNDSVRSCKLA